jgi:GNAT superfamily N-acetyltransferase
MVADSVQISAVATLPDGILELLETSLSEGHDLVERLVAEWEDGTNRFDRTGETLIEARRLGRLVGVGGLNRDPYVDDPGVGRIRHLYVMPAARGMGAGRALVIALVDHARGSFERVRLRAGPDEARDFYLRLGFEETPDEEDSTHQIRLR